MPGDSLKKVRPGDPLRVPAGAYNLFVDAARDFQSRSRGLAQNAVPSFRQAGIVLVRNDSGADRERFDALGIDTPIISPTTNLLAFKNRVAVAGSTPSQASHSGKFVVLLEPVPAGRIGRACASGVCPVKVNVTDEDHRFADVNDGQPGSLASGLAGAARILWKESGTGEKWAVVKLGNPAGGASAVPVKLTASLGGGAYTCKVQVWTGSAWSDKPGATDITCVNLSETTGGCTSGLDLTPAPVVLATAISAAHFFERESNAKYKA